LPQRRDGRRFLAGVMLLVVMLVLVLMVMVMAVVEEGIER
jgi:hypothetical protein